MRSVSALIVIALTLCQILVGSAGQSITGFPDTENWSINVTNTCSRKLKVQLRYYDGSLKHVVCNNVHKKQRISLSTDKRLTVSLVAAQDINGNDVFERKCLDNTRNYMRYSDGLCYKLYYSMEDEVIECDAEDSSTIYNGGLRKPSGSASITSRHDVNSNQRC